MKSIFPWKPNKTGPKLKVKLFEVVPVPLDLTEKKAAIKTEVAAKLNKVLKSNADAGNGNIMDNLINYYVQSIFSTLKEKYRDDQLWVHDLENAFLSLKESTTHDKLNIEKELQEVERKIVELEKIINQGGETNENSAHQYRPKYKHAAAILESN